MLKYFAILEDSKRPLLGPNVKILKFWGLFLPRNGCKRYFYIFIHVFLTFFILTTYVDLWFVKDDLDLVIYNLKIISLGTVSFCKVWTFIVWQKDWCSVIDYVTIADIAQRSTHNSKKLKLIKSYTKYSRNMTIYYNILLLAVASFEILQPFLMYYVSTSYKENVSGGTDSNNMEVINSWIPFVKNTTLGYLIASICQIFTTVYGGGWIASFDCIAYIIMVFIKAELQLLRIDCAQIYGTEESPVSDEVAVERLQECHKRRIELIKYARVFDSCLSPNMLLYILICSVMLCITTYQITYETNITKQLMITVYLMFGIAQLFIYCWHSTDVFYASLELSRGPYECLWWNRGSSHNKNIYILSCQLNKLMVFSAGPFTTLTMTTYINILKGSYSYYTLLSSSHMKVNTEI